MGRVVGAEIKPTEVKVGDKIRSVVEEAKRTVEYSGVVGSVHKAYENPEFISIYGEGIGPLLFSHYWAGDSNKTSIILEEAVPEPHVLESAKPGDWFTIDRTGFGKVWTYTKIRDNAWLEESVTRGKDNHEATTYLYTDDKTKNTFDAYGIKELNKA